MVGFYFYRGKATVFITVDSVVGGENKEEITLVKEQDQWRVVAPGHWFHLSNCSCSTDQ